MLVPPGNFLITNWKMKPAGLAEAKKIASGYAQIDAVSQAHLVVAPPVVFLSAVREVLAQSHPLSGQDGHQLDAASQTGQISLAQLSSVGCRYVILGHSEARRAGQDDQLVNIRARAAISHDLTPIVCVGESARDAKGVYLGELQRQIEQTFAGFSRQDFEHMILAYEPIWAIGAEAERDATLDEIRETMIFIKRVIDDMTGNIGVGRLTFVYGGSVNEEQELRDIIALDTVSGALVGRASLDAKLIAKLYETLSEL